MNIAASASPLPSSVRGDAVQDPTRLALGPDSDCVDPIAVPDDGLQDFGRLLSERIGKEAGAGRRDVDGRGTGRSDAQSSTPPAPVAEPTTAATARPAADGVAPADAQPATPEAPKADDLAAQIALVSQWVAVAAQPAAAAGLATGRVVPSLDGTDVKAKLDTVRAAAAQPGGAPTSAQGAASAQAAVAGAAVADAAPAASVATAAVADAAAVAAPSFAATAVAPTLDRPQRTAAPSGVAAPASRTPGARPSAAGAVVAPDAARAAALASIERLFGVPGATPGAAAPATASAWATERPVAVGAFGAPLEPQPASPLEAQPASQLAPPVAGTTPVATAAAQPAAMPTTIALHEQVGTPAWSHEVGHAALRMAANDLQNVSLRLNPEHLGPMEVQMRVDQGVAHLQFTAAHAETRQALESSRTTLDQMFAAQGLKLGDCSVGQQSTNAAFARDFGAASQGERRDGRGASAAPADDGVVAATVTTRAARAVGLVDTFA